MPLDMAGYLVKQIELQGVVLIDREYTRQELDKAILNGCFTFITYQGRNIGFVSWVLNPGEVFLENLLIFKGFRGKFCMISLRKMLREKYGNVKFDWKNRKTQRLRSDKKEMSLC